LDYRKEQFHATYESIKTINLIKNTLTEITSSADIKTNILSSVIGLSTGYLYRQLLLDSKHSPVKRVLGSLLQFVVTNLVSKRSRI
jgi:hypothetical protein